MEHENEQSGRRARGKKCTKERLRKVKDKNVVRERGVMEFYFHCGLQHARNNLNYNVIVIRINSKMVYEENNHFHFRIRKAIHLYASEWCAIFFLTQQIHSN